MRRGLRPLRCGVQEDGRLILAVGHDGVLPRLHPKAALAAAKARGHATRRRAAHARGPQALQFAANVLPIISGLKVVRL